MVQSRYMLLVTREDGSFYFLEGKPEDLREAKPKDDLFGKVVSTEVLRRNP